MTTDRRRYFRIEDRALLKYRVVADEDLEQERHFIQANEIRASNLHAALAGIDLRLEDAFEAVREESKAMAQALELLNRKLTLIERVVALESGQVVTGTHREHEPSEVSLSGGGIAIAADTPLALNAPLAIDLVLLPSHHSMRAIGRVVDCRRGDGERFQIAVQFEEIREQDREALIQHVLRKQAAELRAARGGAAA
ncbi:MAG: PilZ domain-containing protein [Gammaproteobacteria bacterium]